VDVRSGGHSGCPFLQRAATGLRVGVQAYVREISAEAPFERAAQGRIERTRADQSLDGAVPRRSLQLEDRIAKSCRAFCRSLRLLGSLPELALPRPLLHW
jgi:hypothetical protein